MLIGARIPDGETGRGAAALVLCTRSGALNVEPRGGACAHINSVAHCGPETKLSMVGAWPALTMAEVASTGP